jgi:hypothetical protein
MTLIPEIGRPLVSPESRRELRRTPAAVLSAVRPEILAAADAFLAEPTAESFLEFEQTVLRVLQLAACHVVAVVVLLHHDARWTTAAVATERDAAQVPLRQSRSARDAGAIPRGSAAFAEDAVCERGPRQETGQAAGGRTPGAVGIGRYPALAALGIWGQATPALMGEVARHGTRASSFEEAQQIAGSCSTGRRCERSR